MGYDLGSQIARDRSGSAFSAQSGGRVAPERESRMPDLYTSSRQHNISVEPAGPRPPTPALVPASYPRYQLSDPGPTLLDPPMPSGNARRRTRDPLTNHRVGGGFIVPPRSHGRLEPNRPEQQATSMSISQKSSSASDASANSTHHLTLFNMPSPANLRGGMSVEGAAGSTKLLVEDAFVPHPSRASPRQRLEVLNVVRVPSSRDDAYKHVMHNSQHARTAPLHACSRPSQIAQPEVRQAVPFDRRHVQTVSSSKSLNSNQRSSSSDRDLAMLGLLYLLGEKGGSIEALIDRLLLDDPKFAKNITAGAIFDYLFAMKPDFAQEPDEPSAMSSRTASEDTLPRTPNEGTSSAQVWVESSSAYEDPGRTSTAAMYPTIATPPIHTRGLLAGTRVDKSLPPTPAQTSPADTFVSGLQVCSSLHNDWAWAYCHLSIELGQGSRRAACSARKVFSPDAHSYYRATDIS